MHATSTARLAVSIVDQLTAGRYTPEQRRTRQRWLRAAPVVDDNGHWHWPAHTPGGLGGQFMLKGEKLTAQITEAFKSAQTPAERQQILDTVKASGGQVPDHLAKAGAPSAPSARTAEASSVADYKDRTARLRSKYEAGIKGEPKLLAGGQMADTYEVTFNDGSRGILKVGKHNKAFPLIPPRLQADHEELGASVAAAVGIGTIPAVVRIDEATVLKEYGEGSPGAMYEFDPDLFRELIASNGDDLRSLGLLDVLTHHGDRHARNWLVGRNPATPGKKRIVPIDNGNMFGPVSRDENRDLVPMEVYQNPAMTAPFTRTGKVDRNGLPELEYRSGGLKVARLESIRDELRKLKGDFDAAGPGMDIQFRIMLERLGIMIEEAQYRERQKGRGHGEGIHGHRHADRGQGRIGHARRRDLDVQRPGNRVDGAGQADDGLDGQADPRLLRRLGERGRDHNPDLARAAKALKAPRAPRGIAPARPGAGTPFKKNDNGQWVDRYGQFADLPDVIAAGVKAGQIKVIPVAAPTTKATPPSHEAPPKLAPKRKGLIADRPVASTVRARILDLETAEERREYLAGFDLTHGQSKALAKDLGARVSLISTEDQLDKIVGYFNVDGPAKPKVPKAVPSKVTKGAADEQLRPDSAGALAKAPAGRVPGDAGPGEVLPEAGRGDRVPGRRPRRPRGDAAAKRPAVSGAAAAGSDGEGDRRVGGAAGDVAGVGGGRGDLPLTAPPVFRPSDQRDLAPAKERDRLEANLEALRTLRRIQRDERPATAAEQAVLARWSGWGALPKVFDEPPIEKVYKDAQRELRHGVDGGAPLLPGAEFAAGRRTIRNAHYTDAEYVSAIWDTLRELGFDGGQVLEPGSGSGNFMGMVPDDIRGDTHITGVELDPLTGAIAQALYPDQDVRVESFTDTHVPEGSFDAAVGNVPFANTALLDPQYNPGRKHSMHNHFILKSLRMTKPGGLVAMLTSRYTMDAEDPKSRQEMAQYGDLVGAVRLPSGAHEAAAGTGVVTDLLIFRRRLNGVEPAGMQFAETRRVTIDGREVAVNELFLDQPEFVLGNIKIDGGNKDFFHVIGNKAAGPALRKALATIVHNAREEGLTQKPGRADRPTFRAPAGARKMKNTITAHPDGTFTRTEPDEWGYPHEVPHKVPAAQAAELRSLLVLRDTTLALRAAEGADNIAEMDRLRGELNERYDAHVGTRRKDGTWTNFGPVSRFTETRRKGKPKPGTAAEDEATEDTVTRTRPKQGGFRSDPHSAVVRVLEEFDPVTGDAKKGSIFRERSVAPRTRASSADTAADALAISLDTHGYVDQETVAELLNVDEAEARESLGDLVFDEPGSDRLIPRAEYLSGNVREKLDAAREAAAMDDLYAPNVDALQRVMPEDLTAENIRVQLGATWIDAKHVQQFLRELLQDKSIKVARSGAAHWDVSGGDKTSPAATSEWGTEDYHAIKIADAVLNGRPIAVKVEGSDSATADKTAAAVDKAAAMRERFEQWVWQDPGRAKDLTEGYNRTFNSLVLRKYDGKYLTLPGMADDFEPHPHVRDAVARIIQEPSVGLWHAVGAGKTTEMVAGAMELRRLGLVRKPSIVVPNHMLEQMTREFYRIYPQARVLAIGSDDLSNPDRKRDVIAAAADPQWDAVIITHGAFKRIPVGVDTEEAYMVSEVEPLRRAYARRREEVILAALAAAEADGVFDADEIEKRIRMAVAEDPTAKDIEARVQIREQNIKAKLTERIEHDNETGKVKKVGITRDPGLTFEQTGIDYLFIDEAHLYKNLATSSQTEGMGIAGSQIATDLHMKLHYLRQRYDRVATLATGTPIANSIREAYTMMRYLRPDLLQDLKIETFDEFASNFGEVVSRMEVGPTGGLRTKSRFARFVNVPEFLRPWLIAGDVMTSEDLLAVRDKDNKPIMKIPQLAEWTDSSGTKSRTPELVVVPASAVLTDKVASLASRAKNLRYPPRKGDDNMLSITGEGRAGALDLRLVGLDSDEPQKLDIAADRIAAVYADNKDREFVGKDGLPVGERGALQLVFSDLGTPVGRRKAPTAKKGEEAPEAASFEEGAGATTDWNAYEALRGKLAERGVPRDKIRFIHEASNDQQKADLFAAARDGRIAVLIGSTQKMGVGTNIQDRAIALHHLDAPWRPADIEQREGRIVRHGNKNPEVQVVRYVTEGSFDAYIWQAISTKGTYINQVMRGRLDVREMDDVGEFVLTATQAVALGTGNPHLIAHTEALAEVTRLDRKRRNHEAEQKNLSRIIQLAEADVATATRHIAAIDAALPKRVDTHGANFAMTVDGKKFAGADARPDAQAALRTALRRAANSGQQTDVGELGGFTVRAHPAQYGGGAVEVELVGVPGRVLIGRDTSAEGDSIGKLQRVLDNLETVRGKHVKNRDRATDDIEHSRARIGAEFADETALAEARARFENIDGMLKADLAERGESVETLDPEAQAAARRAGERADLETHLSAGGGFTSIGQLTAFLEADENQAERVGRVKRSNGAKWGVLSPAGQLVIVKEPDGRGYRVTVPRTLFTPAPMAGFRTQADAKKFAEVLEGAGIPWNTGVDLKEWHAPNGATLGEVIARLRGERREWDKQGAWKSAAVKAEITRRMPGRLKEALLDGKYRRDGLGIDNFERVTPEHREAILAMLMGSDPDSDLATAVRLREYGLAEGREYQTRNLAFAIAKRLETDYRKSNPQRLDHLRKRFEKDFDRIESNYLHAALIERILAEADASGDLPAASAKLRTLAEEIMAERYPSWGTKTVSEVAQSLADVLDAYADRELVAVRAVLDALTRSSDHRAPGKVPADAARVLLAAFEHSDRVMSGSVTVPSSGLNPSPTPHKALVRAAGVDTNPGGEELKHYWTRDPEGLAKWATRPSGRWTALYGHLKKHMPPAAARRVAAKWFQEVFGFASGSDMNRVTSGKPPRGEKIGPG